MGSLCRYSPTNFLTSGCPVLGNVRRGDTLRRRNSLQTHKLDEVLCWQLWFRRCKCQANYMEVASNGFWGCRTSRRCRLLFRHCRRLPRKFGDLKGTNQTRSSLRPYFLSPKSLQYRYRLWDNSGLLHTLGPANSDFPVDHRVYTPLFCLFTAVLSQRAPLRIHDVWELDIRFSLINTRPFLALRFRPIHAEISQECGDCCYGVSKRIPYTETT